MRGARGFVFFTGGVVTDRFRAAFSGAAFLGAVFLGVTFFAVGFFGATFFDAVFLDATFFGVLVAGCFLAGFLAAFLTVLLVVFLAAFLSVFFFAAFLAGFGPRAVVVPFAGVFLRLVVFLTAVLPRVFAFGLRPVAAERGLRDFTRGFLAVFFLAGATTNSL
ncbi:hypothetical protein [Nitrobacter winogradskyi]|uniref:hypothetical protein n=1 Tax=Nitrobacter winogradskyi TaxID=913 RepID=UPI001FCABF44|nr:hypothetical protein [Nitrobacter winogradskyi]